MKIPRWLTSALTLLALTAFTGLAAAQPKAQDRGQPAGAEKKTVDKASPKLMTGKVAQVNGDTKTFTVTAKGKQVTFNAAKLKSLPKVGEIIDITYTGGGGGPLEAINLNSSKSNIY